MKTKPTFKDAFMEGIEEHKTSYIQYKTCEQIIKNIVDDLPYCIEYKQKKIASLLKEIKKNNPINLLDLIKACLDDNDIRKYFQQETILKIFEIYQTQEKQDFKDLKIVLKQLMHKFEKQLSQYSDSYISYNQQLGIIENVFANCRGASVSKEEILKKYKRLIAKNSIRYNEFIISFLATIYIDYFDYGNQSLNRINGKLEEIINSLNQQYKKITYSKTQDQPQNNNNNFMNNNINNNNNFMNNNNNNNNNFMNNNNNNNNNFMNNNNNNNNNFMNNNNNNNNNFMNNNINNNNNFMNNNINNNNNFMNNNINNNNNFMNNNNNFMNNNNNNNNNFMNNNINNNNNFMNNGNNCNNNNNFYYFNNSNFMNNNNNFMNNGNNYLENELKAEKSKNQQLSQEIISLKNTIREKDNIIDDKNDIIYDLKKRIKELQDIKSNNSENKKVMGLMEKLIEKEEALKKMKLRYPFEIAEGEKIMTVNIISVEHNIIHSIICKNTHKFNYLENKIYEKYPELLESKNYFISCGNKINKYKTLEENKIIDNDIITFERLDKDDDDDDISLSKNPFAKKRIS